MTIDLSPIKKFLPNATPDAWINHAVANIPTLLIDHANCEKKAASTAINIIYRYAAHHKLCQSMSRLAREELRHFEQVAKLMKQRGIAHVELTASRYAGGLIAHCRRDDPNRLVDILIVGALIEARSCERFAALIPHLDPELAAFYQSLLKSEARHFEHYLEFAAQYANSATEVDSRISHFRQIEADLIVTPDVEFRFHSGVPVASNAHKS